MGNPPGWVNQSIGLAARAEVQIMPGVAAGLVSAGQVNVQPTGASGMSTANWSTIWFVVAVIYLASIYWGYVSIRSNAS
jgi:hypothetical protein